MSFVPPVFKIHSIFQDAVSLHFYLNTHLTKFEINYSYTKLSAQFYHYFAILSAFLYCWATGAQLIWYFFIWNSFTKFNIEIPVVQMLGFLSVSLGLSSVYILETYYNDIIFLFNQCISIKYHSTPLLIKFPFFGSLDAKVLFIYSFAIPLCTFPIVFALVPFVVSWDTVQLILGNAYLCKCIAAIFYGIMTSYVFWNLISLMMLSFVCFDTITTVSTYFLPRRFSGSFVDFRKYYKVYIEARIVFEGLSKIFSPFHQVLIFVGVFIGSFSSYATLKLQNYMPIMMYLCTPTLSTAVYVAAILLTYMANTPLQNSERFESFWRRYLTRKHDWKLLRSCPLLGYRLGSYGAASATLGVLICDDIVRNTVTILLIGNV